jgi:hypothetical protein
MRSKKAGSSCFTSSTIVSTTARVSAGASPVRIMRWSRCSTIPLSVCTIEVKAAIGIT